MSKFLIVTDTTSTLIPQDSEKYGIEIVPLSVLNKGIEYADGIDINAEQFADLLRNGEMPTTSQPNIGRVEELMKKWKAADYDAILIITISSYLSGTYQGFLMTAKNLDMKNVHVIDSLTVGAPMLDMALTAKRYADAGRSLDDILTMLKAKIKDTYSMLSTKNLENLKKGGRISPVAAGMASLLKIKPLLYLKEDGTCVEKYGMARTDSKIYDMIIEEFKKRNVNAETHEFYIMEAEGMENVEAFLSKAKEAFGTDMSFKIIQLPAVLTCHAGLGSFAVQSCLKN